MTSVRLTRKQHEKLKRIAAREERSASQQMRYLIDHLDGEPEAPDHRSAA